MISIIIPAWNEEKFLPRLLECIKSQTYDNYEVIVADAGSTDKTKSIAEKAGCKVVKGGMPGPGRNNGAKAAKGELLIFLDADCTIEKDFLKDAIEEFKWRNLDVCGVYLTPDVKNIRNFFFLGSFNFWIWITQSFYPNAAASGIICKKPLHEKINGFDETVILSEDMDYVNRAGKLGKFRILIKPKLIFSMRRYEKAGMKTGCNLLLSVFYRAFFGEIRKDVFKYNLKNRK